MFPLQKEQRVYRSESLSVGPSTEEDLATAWLQYRHEGTMDRIYYEGEPGLEWFLQTHKACPTLACHATTPDGPQLRGLGWVTVHPILGGAFRKAEVGMGFFRKVPPTETMRFAWMMIEWVFTELGLSVVFGTTPVNNKAAERYSRRLGFEMHGPLPNFCSWKGGLTSCWISSITIEQWAFIRRNLWQE